MKRSEHLAIIRTNLANERTLLAYLRSFVVIFGGGLAMIQIDVLSDLRRFGIALICIAPVILLVGAIRFFQMRNQITTLQTEET